MDGNRISKKKKRGPGRMKLTLGGKKKLERAVKNKERRNLNRQLAGQGLLTPTSPRIQPLGKW